MSLHVLAYNPEANDNDLRCGTVRLEPGDQVLIAAIVSVDLSGIAIVLPGNTAHRPLHPTRFPTVSTLSGCLARAETPATSGLSRMALTFTPHG